MLPALATVGNALLVITTVSIDGIQPPFEIVQTKTLIPKLSPLTSVVGFAAFTKLPLPLTTLHKPVPIEAVFPFKVAVVALHKLWSAPAFAVVNCPDLLIITVSYEMAQEALLIDQTKVFIPVDKPVTEVFAKLALVMVALPAITDQVPVPTVGTLPFKLVVLAQTF